MRLHIFLIAFCAISFLSPVTIAQAPAIYHGSGSTLATLSSSSQSSTSTGAVFNLDKLAKAIARHETGDCQLGVGKSRNNCFGITNRKGFASYANSGQSYAAFKALWTSKYGGSLPTLRHATTWVCGPSWPTGKHCNGGDPQAWLASVLKSYWSI